MKANEVSQEIHCTAPLKPVLSLTFFVTYFDLDMPLQSILTLTWFKMAAVASASVAVSVAAVANTVNLFTLNVTNFPGSTKAIPP